MSSSIYRFFTIIFIILSLPVYAKNDKDKDKKVIKPYVPVYQGIHIAAELTEPAMGLFSDSWGTSLKADINLKNKLMPTVETGFMNYDKTSEAGTKFISSGSYIKGGLNIPVVINGEEAEDMFFVGLHYGYSSFSYDLKSLTYQNGYWGSEGPSSINDDKASVSWYEAVAGIRVKISGPFSLGWTVQYKSVLNMNKGKYGYPPYIPGYGAYNNPGTGIRAYLYYRLPF